MEFKSYSDFRVGELVRFNDGMYRVTSKSTVAGFSTYNVEAV